MENNDLGRFLKYLELSVYYKRQYYATRPIMRFLRMVGIERGIESRASQYAMQRAHKELEKASGSCVTEA